MTKKQEKEQSDNLKKWKMQGHRSQDQKTSKMREWSNQQCQKPQRV